MTPRPWTSWTTSPHAAGPPAGLCVLGALILLAALGLFAVWLLRRRRPVAPDPISLAPVSAERLLAERFAAGEIDETEYRQRLTTLRTPHL